MIKNIDKLNTICRERERERESSYQTMEGGNYYLISSLTNEEVKGI